MSAPVVRPVVGLEIHAELKTRTKLFCRCANAADSPPNTLVCPVCLGLPGALPVMNREAVRLAVLAATALNADVAARALWDRKSYTYPDLPKNYQISQYAHPLATGGHVEVTLRDGRRKRVGLIRAHLEEDAGKTGHESGDTSTVDLNRAGVPLLEIVSLPEIESSEEAGAYARGVRDLLRWIGACEGNMEQGQIRFEPNINLHISSGGAVYRTPITEVKNLNSFRALEATIDYEIQRQTACWRQDPTGYTMERAGRENRGWDAAHNVTVFQREKEEAHDYRYFPDPDLVPVLPAPVWVEELRQTLGERLPVRVRRYRDAYGLADRDIDLLTADPATGELLDRAVELGGTAKRAASLLTGVGARLANERGLRLWELGLEAGQLAGIVALVDTGDLTPSAANGLFGQILGTGEGARAAAERLGLLIRRDGAVVDTWVREALESNPKAVGDVREGGKNATKAFGYLVGQVMQRSRGAASPADVERRLRSALGA